ncbi:methyltransferase family protein [Tamaricihabitans halophyticus]|uniref:Methyltransferase family protein n=1 Tax=Tamaricihabitans halophyticus TaxID=1262583 RepID=A0A4R2QYS5_9PSEU|nr:class I SAM-dependent methyltransferase [Tamaricihabitans halophyticus]TCP54847.1 methyltransferase family protein [Tamaricihabitans halophyticus]
MAMNWLHRKRCSSTAWAEVVREQLLPWALDGVELGEKVLEIGPGYGANLRELVELAPKVTALELDPVLAEGLRAKYHQHAEIIEGDGAAMPLPEGAFDSVVCFTMLHHVPTARAQDALFAEACRVLRAGGQFAGSDGAPGARFRLIHLGDTYNPLDPATLPDRLRAAGFTEIRTTVLNNRLRWSARKPAHR